MKPLDLSDILGVPSKDGTTIQGHAAIWAAFNGNIRLSPSGILMLYGPTKSINISEGLELIASNQPQHIVGYLS